MKNIVLLCMAVVLFICANLYAADGDLMVNGVVSIGTTTPSATLSINGPSSVLSGATPLAFTVDVYQSQNYVISDNVSAPYFPGVSQGDTIQIGLGVYAVQYIFANTIQLTSVYQDIDASGVSVYSLPPLVNINNTINGVVSNKVTVTNAGNVGIGTAAPAAKLDVQGTLKAKGSITFGTTSPGTGRANKALCWTSSGYIGYCINAINSSGTCTCNVIN